MNGGYDLLKNHVASCSMLNIHADMACMKIRLLEIALVFARDEWLSLS